MTRLEQIMATITANGMREWTDERVKQAMQEYAKECAQASLVKAAGNGKVTRMLKDSENDHYCVNKLSICNPENIILP